MQGDSVQVDGFLYEAVDEQRSKCVTCQKVIYKLLQRAHSNSHALLKPSLASSGENLQKNLNKGVKKISLQLDNRDYPNENNIKVRSDELERVEENGKCHLVDEIQLPYKIIEEKYCEPPKKMPKNSEFVRCLKKLRKVRAVLLKMIKVNKRCRFVMELKYFRRWVRSL